MCISCFDTLRNGIILLISTFKFPLLVYIFNLLFILSVYPAAFAGRLGNIFRYKILLCCWWWFFICCLVGILIKETVALRCIFQLLLRREGRLMSLCARGNSGRKEAFLASFVPYLGYVMGAEQKPQKGPSHLSAALCPSYWFLALSLPRSRVVGFCKVAATKGSHPVHTDPADLEQRSPNDRLFWCQERKD